MIITPMDCFYIFMIGLIVAGLVVIEIQIHTLKSTVEKYIDVRLHKGESLKKLSENNLEKHLTK
tara:strand:- start:3142 stop:3333 length:192 start_codon:yes stop_codon:yes gene_type:complete